MFKSVQQLREARGMNQAQLARASMVSQSTLSRHERGQAKLKASLRPALCLALGVSLEEINQIIEREYSADKPAAPVSEFFITFCIPNPELQQGPKSRVSVETNLPPELDNAPLIEGALYVHGVSLALMISSQQTQIQRLANVTTEAANASLSAIQAVGPLFETNETQTKES